VAEKDCPDETITKTILNTKDNDNKGADDDIEVRASDEKLSRYFEESKDSDEPRLNYDDDDGETICMEDPADSDDLLV